MHYFEYVKNAAARAIEEIEATGAKAAEGARQPMVDILAHIKTTEIKADLDARTPEEVAHDYALARQSKLGEYSGIPSSMVPQCLPAKAARRKERLDLVNRSLAACPDRVEEAKRLRTNMDEVENMRCAKQVYLDNDQSAPAALRDDPPVGFTRATEAQLKEMGLNQKMLTPEDSEFKAAVYMKDPAIWGENPQPPAVLAFRGSTAAKEDWDNNCAQGVNNESPYYQRAVQIGNRLAKNKANVLLVGHSLGGGMASAAQGGSGLHASTYNAAGLHPETVARYSFDIDHMQAEPEKIAAYRIKGEALTKTQESGWKSHCMPVAVGSKHELEPAHTWEYFNRFDRTKAQKDAPYRGINPDYPDTEIERIANQRKPAMEQEQYQTYLHGMDQVIAATEKQKIADEQALKRCLGQGGKP